MTQIIHMNFGWLHKPPLPPACCHGLLIRSAKGIALIESGIGLHDIADPVNRIGQDAIDAAGFRFLPEVTAARQLAAMEIDASDVTDIVLTHGDPDHAGGLADFPSARVHLAVEEFENLNSGNPRYRALQFAHRPKWVTYETNDAETIGLPSRRIQTDLDVDIRLVPLPGHTRGHCGVAIRDDDRWIIHVGDAYYLRAELSEPDHPVSALAAMRADDDQARLKSLQCLRDLLQREPHRVTCFGYHDVSELPEGMPTIENARSMLPDCASSNRGM